MATVKKTLEEAIVYFHININCVDPLGRTALHIAIENENLEMIEVWHCLYSSSIPKHADDSGKLSIIQT